VQQATNLIVLIAAGITFLTALLPLWKWVWRTYLARHFDAKKEHYNELIDEAKWYEDRAMKLDSFRKQLLCGKIYQQVPDRFKLAELVSKLDRKDKEWARKVEDVTLLTEACERKQEECLNNAAQCREFADEVGRKVLFW
jgi:hypothetical protein